QLDAVDRPGQPDVDKRQRGAVLRRQRQGLGARTGDAGDGKSGARQYFFDVAGDERLILDDEDADLLAPVRWRNHLKPIACCRRAPTAGHPKVLSSNTEAETLVPSLQRIFAHQFQRLMLSKLLTAAASSRKRARVAMLGLD